MHNLFFSIDQNKSKKRFRFVYEAFDDSIEILVEDEKKAWIVLRNNIVISVLWKEEKNLPSVRVITVQRFERKCKPYLPDFVSKNIEIGSIDEWSSIEEDSIAGVLGYWEPKFGLSYEIWTFFFHEQDLD